MKKNAYALCALSILLSTPLLAQKAEVTNGITDKMTKYKYLFGRYKPDTFSITANKIPLALGEKKEMDLPDGKLNVRYDFEFKGHKKGAKVVTFEVPKDMETVKFTFNWKKKSRILIKGLDAVKVTEIQV